MGFMNWRAKSADVLQQGGVIGPDERLPWPQTAVMGVQHVIAMFGATVLAPILMGFDPNVAILMSGVGTLIFFLITGGKVPSYLGSSFAFIGVVIAATGYAGQGPNANIAVALGGIIACGLLYTLIGVLVQAVGTGWIERFMPPVVTGSVVAVIGLNLAGIPIKNMAASNFDSWMQALTFVCVGLVAVLTRGMVQRLLILVGLIVASIIYAVLTNGLGLGKPLDLSGVANAASMLADFPRVLNEFWTTARLDAVSSQWANASIDRCNTTSLNNRITLPPALSRASRRTSPALPSTPPD